MCVVDGRSVRRRAEGYTQDSRGDGEVPWGGGQWCMEISAASSLTPSVSSVTATAMSVDLPQIPKPKSD